jgi:hypothetical protein
MNLEIYFDTSAINWLFDDPRRDSILGRLVGSACIYISIFTVAELAATPSTGMESLTHHLKRITFSSQTFSNLSDVI